MGRDRGSSRKSRDDCSSCSASSSSSSDSESPEGRRRTKKRERSSRHKDISSRRKSRHRSGKGSRESSRKRKSRSEDKEERRKRRHKKKSRTTPDSPSLSPSSSDVCDPESSDPEALVRLIIRRYPHVAGDLQQLLQMIDNGEGVDISGISNKSLVKLLKKLFWSLKLKQNENGVFLLPQMGLPTLEIVGSLLSSHLKLGDSHHPNPGSTDRQQSSPSALECKRSRDDTDEMHDKQESPIPCRRRLIGPEMPSRELLDAAAKLTEAENLLREADLDVDNNLLIGPPPPAMVAEAESANEAERFEEVARIAAADVDKPYDVLGVNWKTSFENIKKRYWKLSLIVHPDKCSHPQSHQAFVILNQAFKYLQDPDKRKALDEKIKLKEEQEEFKIELQALREAAQWRRSQGISIEGDEELLAIPKEAPKRDEWMTTLPPERKPGMTMQSTSFSRTSKEGRGDTSIWTDSPLDKAEKAKQKNYPAIVLRSTCLCKQVLSGITEYIQLTSYLEAYNRTKALAEADDQKRGVISDAELVDKYNSSKRSKSLVQKHREEKSNPRKKSKQPEKEEWEGKHPWKPWDREKDLAAGRQKVNFEQENMAEGLASRFSSGTYQRNFL
ncbi:putative Chaperone protein dnaJ 11, chloroplastic [Cocos nucifera]|nr:putative Chaperone protein dnaJ 11, chloroplastic [Cocos nucifera]